MKKVLVIAYYWPPSGGSGVQRWLKFVKYLPEYGWQPIVFTPENPSFDVRDESLLKDIPVEAEVIHFPIREPYKVFLRLSRFFGGGEKSAKPTDLISDNKPSLFQMLGIWFRGNFFVPDPRVFWVNPSYAFLKDFVRDRGINTIITTGPPHSVHLIGYKLKKKYPKIQWLADFRDPWSQWGLLDTLKVSFPVRKIHQWLESKVLRLADIITTVTPFYVKQFETSANRPVKLLTNGFDKDDFKEISYHRSDRFIVRHVGVINEKCNPRIFMNALRNLISQDHGFASKIRVEFIGDVHPQFRSFVLTDELLAGVTDFRGSIPHDELIHCYGEASVLLLVLTGYKDSQGYLPGKLFEYLATGLPIISIGPLQGDAASLLKQTSVGIAIADEDQAGMENALSDLYKRWTSGAILPTKEPAVEKFSRKELTKCLAQLLSEQSIGEKINSNSI